MFRNSHLSNVENTKAKLISYYKINSTGFWKREEFTVGRTSWRKLEMSSVLKDGLYLDLPMGSERAFQKERRVRRAVWLELREHVFKE